jgi:hypothetical protein
VTARQGSVARRSSGLAASVGRWVRRVRGRRLPLSRVADTVVEVGPCVAGWAVRLGAAAAGAALVATAWFGYGRWPGGSGVLVTVAAFVVATVWPPLVVGLLLLVGVGVFGAGAPPLWLLLVLVLLGHVAVVAGGLASRVRFVTRVEWAVVRPLARELLVVQAGAQVLALLGALVGGVHTDAGDEVRAGAVVLVVVVLALVLPWAPSRDRR